jgi:predicted tellurium resistance membrane protein TerC
MEMLFSSEAMLTLFTLTTLEIVLGIDNVVFIAILANKLEPSERKKARFVGLSLALILRVMMLLGASWVMRLTHPLFVLYGFAFSGRNLLLIIGGAFLIIKTAFEIYELLNEDTEAAKPTQEVIKKKYWGIIAQIIFVDLILSFDSIITAVGMTDNIVVIIIAIFIAIATMIIAAEPVGRFVHKHLSIKVIALCFIAYVGFILIANGFDIEISKNYLYVTLFFSLSTQALIILIENKKNKL